MIKSAVTGMYRSGATYAEISEATGLYKLVIANIITEYFKPSK